MKKFLPLFIFLIGVVVMIGVGIILLRSRDSNVAEDGENIPEISLEKRPIASLTPSEDGHWLKMKIEKLRDLGSKLEYELLYLVAEGGATQGVPGTIQLDGQGLIERDLLLGSESSGKFRYDEGVEKGTLTLRFRDEKGKLVGKLKTDFYLQSSISELSTVDGKFKFNLDKELKGIFYITMGTFGLPKAAPEPFKSGPYGVFSSDKNPNFGKNSLNGNVFRWSGTDWEEVKRDQSSDLGIFISTE